MQQPLKVAILSRVLPPHRSGQSKVLYRLLSGWSPEDYCLISNGEYNRPLYPTQQEEWLPGTYIQHVPTNGHMTIPKTHQFPRFLFRPLIHMLNIRYRARKLKQIIKAQECKAIVACTGDYIDFPSSFLASRYAQVPFFAYMFDWYAYQWTNQLDRTLARWVEPYILRSAAGIIVPNERMQEELRNLYGVSSNIIYNPCDEASLDNKSIETWPTEQGKITIVFTGAVYHANADALTNLVAALCQLNQPEIRLHIYSNQPASMLKLAANDDEWVVWHDHLSQEPAADVQRKADILFLPLGFHTGIDEVIRTAAPSKLGDYLASGRPLLVHAPANSFVATYVEKHQCGVVVDQDSPSALAMAIETLLEDSNVRKQISQNARNRAHVDFDLLKAQRAFREILLSSSTP